MMPITTRIQCASRHHKTMHSEERIGAVRPHVACVMLRTSQSRVRSLFGQRNALHHRLGASAGSPTAVPSPPGYIAIPAGHRTAELLSGSIHVGLGHVEEGYVEWGVAGEVIEHTLRANILRIDGAGA